MSRDTAPREPALTVLGALLDLLAPPACLACGAPGRALCAGCRRELPHLEDLCPRCALPRPCGRRCPAAAATWQAAWAPVAHAGPARALVHALKFRGHVAAAEHMAASVAALAPRGLLAGAVVPVPTSRARVRERGFDQAELLAGAVAARAGLPVARALARTARSGGEGHRQVGADRRAREAAARAALEPVAGAVPDACVLLDDVHTTGATLRAAARALRAGGARRVVAVAYARTL